MMTSTSKTTHRLWWERPDLCYKDGSLHFGGQDVAQLAKAAGTPLFMYRPPRVVERADAIRNALRRKDIPFRLYFAMKANRFMPLLTYIRLMGDGIGLDVCSPREIAHARMCGFAENDISFTATSVSERDIDALTKWPGVSVNCDSLSSLRRLGERMPEREIGIRINPSVGVGYDDNEMLQYAGHKTTKFGIYEEHFEEALAIARQYDLRVTTLHLHIGLGYLTHQLPVFEEALRIVTRFATRVPGLARINIGGGLGTPLTERDLPLDLDAWADVIARTLGPLGVMICVEPGGYLVRDAGALIFQVNTVERKRETLFIGVDAGYNTYIETSLFHMPAAIVPCRARPAGTCLRPATIAGNINEAVDLFAEDLLMPEIEEGEYLALLNAGAYGGTMVSDHCMRGQFSEYAVFG